MRLKSLAICTALLAASPGFAGVPAWSLRPAVGNIGEQLVFDSGAQVTYVFTCEPTDIAVTQTGVTDILDMNTNSKVGDGPDAKMPEGAALMALFGGKGSPDFQPASATKNPNKGWDLTIHLAKNDKQLRAISSSDMISLFTTGYTEAVEVDGQTRDIWKGFLKRCQSNS